MIHFHLIDLNDIKAWLLNSPPAYFKRKGYYGFTLDLATRLLN